MSPFIVEYESAMENDHVKSKVDPDLVEVSVADSKDSYADSDAESYAESYAADADAAAAAAAAAAVASDPFSNDPKRMVKYHLNWWGLPFSLAIIYYYGNLIFHQMSAQLPTVLDDLLPISVALKVRYIGAFAYFVACLLHRQYVFECRNAEGPLLVATVLELYYLLNCNPKEPSPTMLQLAKPVAIAVVCFMRRKPGWRSFMNPWSKDKSELIKLIQDAKRDLGITSL